MSTQLNRCSETQANLQEICKICNKSTIPWVHQSDADVFSASAARHKTDTSMSRTLARLTLDVNLLLIRLSCSKQTDLCLNSVRNLSPQNSHGNVDVSERVEVWRTSEYLHRGNSKLRSHAGQNVSHHCLVCSNSLELRPNKWLQLCEWVDS